MRDYLGPFETEIRRFATQPADIIDQAILQWRVMYTVVREFQTRHPDWTFIQYENLARDPVSGYRDLYSSLGLSYDAAVRSAVETFSARENPTEVSAEAFRSIRRDSPAVADIWGTRLTTEEIARIRRGVEVEFSWFYNDDDWEPR